MANTKTGSRSRLVHKGNRDRSRRRPARPWLTRRSVIGASCVVAAAALGLGLVGVTGVLGTSSRPLSTTSAAANSATVSAPIVPTPGGAVSGKGAYDAVVCPSTSSCVAVGANSGGVGVVATTTNGGTNWTPATVPAGSPELDAVACSDTTHCVAVGPDAALSSSDGGTTWALHALPDPTTTLLGVSCSASLACVAVGVAPNPGGPFAGRVVLSSDGGVTWSAASVPGAAGLGSVSCPSTTRCVAVGATVIVSDDHGQTWHLVPVLGGIGSSLRTVTCAGSQLCVAVGPNPLATIQTSVSGYAIVSSDGGSTWANVGLPQGSGPSTVVTCGSSTSCFAVGMGLPGGSAPTFLSSGDGGGTWSAPSPPPVAAIAGMSCAASTTCVLVGQGTSGPVAASTTDGSNWNVQTVVVP